MTPLPVFPNYTQMRQPLPHRVWDWLRWGSIAFTLSVVALLVIWPRAGLWLVWGLLVPLLPALWLLAPGLWRNVCPIASIHQIPRFFGFTRGLTLPRRLREYGYVIGVAIFVAVVPARKLTFNENGPALAVLILGVLAAAFAGGLVFKGKGGWCSSGVCPLFPVQRVYGQTPFAVVPNSICRTCVGCAKNCYDFNPHVAYLADLHDPDDRYRAYRKVFAGGFPGLILAFYTSPVDLAWYGLYARFALFIAAGIGLFFLLETFVKVSTAKVAALFGAVAINLYYWYTFPLVAENFAEAVEADTPDALVWSVRTLVLAVSAVWLWRTYRKEQRFLAGESAPAGLAPRLSMAGSVAIKRAGLGRPEVTFPNEQRRVVVEPGRSLLEVVEQAGLKIESGCRMGVCGADPVAVVEGMDNCSPISAEERNTLERLGLASNTRMACVCRVRGDVSVSLAPERPKTFSSSVIAGANRDPEVKRVVIVGNGVAGVTAADHVRRRHPGAEIHLVARERHHLYNRMAIERLIYGRSAMQGLYLQAEQWYEDLAITTWLNTRATGIDRERRTVTLGTGESLPYDRLVLAMGSRSTVPAIEGFGLPGTFVLREADDAFAIRAYAQEHGCRAALVAGGGLLGLEAAHALHKLGLRVAVLERGGSLLRRQLDERGGELLRGFLEGLGLEIVTGAETVGVSGEGRLRQVTLKDGRTLPGDLLLVAAGVTPNIELAREAGLTVNRGVRVDDYLRTSDPVIYAAGDIAEHRGQVYGLWPVAAEQAQIVAVNCLAPGGAEKPYEGSIPSTLLKVVGVDMASVGQFDAPSAGAVVIVLEEPEARRYRKLVVQDGLLVGAILLGYPLLAPVVTAAVKRHADVSAMLPDLHAGRWETLERAPAGTPRPRVTPAAAGGGAPAPDAARRLRAGHLPAPRMPVSPPAPEVPVLRLRALGGPVDGASWEFAGSSGSLGRAGENAVGIPDASLSRRHALITYQEGVYWLHDPGSTNGTFVNEGRVNAPHPLRTGDRIRAGATELLVEVAGPGV